MDFEKFRERQSAIYRSFANARTTVKKQGLSVDPFIAEEKSGVLIVLRHAPDIARQAARCAKHIADIVPGTLAYDEHLIHTTIADHLLIDVRASAELLQRLCTNIRRIHSALTALAHDCSIAYTTYCANATTVIAKGHPNDTFIAMVDATIEACTHEGLTMRVPWGAHITLARFGERGSPENAERLYTYLDAIPALGQSNPVAIDVGTFQCAQGKLIFTIQEHFPLTQKE